MTAVVLSFGRRAELVETLERLHEADYPGLDVLVIDNGSPASTLAGIAEHFERVRFLRLPYNVGPSARDYAAGVTGAKYIVHFDDDSAPEPHAISRMVDIFEADPGIGVIPFNVIGGPYTGEFMVGRPSDDLVGFINCGVGIRPEAIKDAGYLDPDFFVYAEDWDLAIRVRNARWRFHFDPEIRAHHRTGDEARNLELRRTQTARNEAWIVLKYYPLARIPVLLFRVLYWNIQTARSEGARSSPWYAVKGFLRGCWHWRTPVAKRQTIDPQILEAFELRSGFTALQPARPAIRATLLRRLKILGASTLPR